MVLWLDRPGIDPVAGGVGQLDRPCDDGGLLGGIGMRILPARALQKWQFLKFRLPGRLRWLGIGQELKDAAARWGAFLPKTWALPKVRPIPLPDANRHMVISGEPRQGKSSLAFLLIVQDVLEHTGVIVLDPHDLTERIEDLCAVLNITPHIIDPARGLCPVIDPFEVPPGMTPSQVIEILLMSLRSIWAPKQGWGEQTAQLLRNTFKLCIELNKTFFDSYLFLKDPRLRQDWIDLLPDGSEAKTFWNGHIRRMSPNQVERDINAPLDKLDAFFAIESLRPCFQRRGSTIHFDQIMDNGEVCLMFLRRNDLATATELFGAVALAKLHISIIQRVHTKKTNWINWYLDEAYQYWNTSVVLEGMAEAAKFGLGVRILITDDSSVSQTTIKLKCWNSQAPLYPFG